MWTDAVWDDIPSSEAVHGLPRSHWNVHLRTFDWSVVKNGDAKRDMVLRFMDLHEQGKAPHLLLLGRAGSGKTHLAVGLHRWAVYQTDLSESRFVRVQDFSHRVKKGFSDEDRHDPFEELDRVRLLVLDDPFGRDPTPYEIEQIIPRLIETAYSRGASLVVTANHDVEGFRAKLAEHEVSRLMEGAIRIGFFQDDDYRLRRGG